MAKAKILRAVASTLLVSGTALTSAYIAEKQREEGFTAKPVIPVQGDRPTIGFGSTFYEDGTPVKMTDPPITRERAAQIARVHDERELQAFVQTLGDVTFFPQELDLYFGWRYQYGLAAWKKSGMLRELKQGRRVKACQVLLQYKYIHSSTLPKPATGWTVSKRDKQGMPVRWRYDCSTPGNKVCRGVHERNVRRYEECMKYAELDELPAQTVTAALEPAP